MKHLWLLIGCSVMLAGCSKPAGGGNNSPSAESSNRDSALSTLHARPDPVLLAQVRSQPPQTIALASTGANTGGGVVLANLPAVSQAPFAPPADQVVYADLQQSRVDSHSANGSIWPFGSMGKPIDDHATAGGAGNDQSVQIASYSPYRSTSHAATGSLVPPPPAVALSTQAQPISFAAPIDVYGNPYTGSAPQYSDAAPARAPGSLFGMGAVHNTDNNTTPAEHKHIDFVPITPTGMDARSAYKQRDDLKLLWKGTISSSPLQALAQRDNRIAQGLNTVTVCLPPEPSRGSLNVSQRQVDITFKSAALDRRIFPEVKKLQLDLAQAYYRYLYAFNKYALAQQTVAARKQELDYADNAAEKQRATADWATARTDADAATDDMKSAQYELASAAGAQATRVIIGRVSGVTPSADSLTQEMDSANPVEQAAGKHSLLGSLFHHSAIPETNPAAIAPNATAAAKSLSGKEDGKSGNKSARAKSKSSDTDKTDKGNKGNKDKTAKHDKKAPVIHAPAVAKDLSPAPDAGDSSAASSTSDRGAAGAAGDSISGSSVAYSNSSAVALVLKSVSVTPRKSIIRVAIRNDGSDNFTFDPDTVGVREGLNKLPEAMVRADFDTTKVAPNQEVSGTITILPLLERPSFHISGRRQQVDTDAQVSKGLCLQETTLNMQDFRNQLRQP